MTQFVNHSAGASEAQQKMALAFLLRQDSTGLARDGVLAGLGVSQTGTASSSVVIGRGAGVVQDTVTAGAQMPVNDTDLTLDVLGPNPMGGLPRNDIIVFDAATVTAGAGGVRAIVGTPNASPTDPTVPATALPLARLRHAASATTIPTANIDDLRTYTGPAPSSDSGWLTLTTTGFSGTIVNTVKYRKLGDVVYMQGNVNSFTAGSFQTLGTLPVGYRPAVASHYGATSNSGTNSMAINVSAAGVVQVYCQTTSGAFTGLANVVFPTG